MLQDLLTLCPTPETLTGAKRATFIKLLADIADDPVRDPDGEALVLLMNLS